MENTDQNKIDSSGVEPVSTKAMPPQAPAKPKMKLKLSKGKLIGLIVVLVIIWLIAVQVMAADRYQAVVVVVEGENKVGINPTTERLDFGDLSRDNGSSRFINLTASQNCFLCLGGEKYIMIWKFGEISELMKVDKNNFVLKPGEDQRVEFSVYAPVSAPYKEYTGKVWVIKWPKIF